jgi:hypothetical protein
MADFLKNIYHDIYNAPRMSNVTINNKVKQYRQKLGQGSNINKRRVIIVDPVNLMPIKAVPSKKSEGKYKLFNKLAPAAPPSKNEYFNLFKAVVKIAPKKKLSKKKEDKPCPPGSERNPKTGRCKKIIIKKKK